MRPLPFGWEGCCCEPEASAGQGGDPHYVVTTKAQNPLSHPQSSRPHPLPAAEEAERAGGPGGAASRQAPSPPAQTQPPRKEFCLRVARSKGR